MPQDTSWSVASDQDGCRASDRWAVEERDAETTPRGIKPGCEPPRREDFSQVGRHELEVPRQKSFRLSARVSSSSPDAVEPVLRRLIAGGEVHRGGGEFTVEVQMEGTSAKELNRALLSALRRVEKKTRLRAEWTLGGKTERYFDYVLKKTIES